MAVKKDRYVRINILEVKISDLEQNSKKKNLIMTRLNLQM